MNNYEIVASLREHGYMSVGEMPMIGEIAFYLENLVVNTVIYLADEGVLHIWLDKEITASQAFSLAMGMGDCDGYVREDGKFISLEW